MTKSKTETLVISRVSKNYDTIQAVKDVSFSTQTGEVIALLGPNGAGKSTLMNMISGFLAPTTGTIEVFGKDVASCDILTKKEIGFLPEGAPMYADMTVKLFLTYMIELKLQQESSNAESLKKLKQNRENELLRIVEIAKIDGVLNQRIETLSKGYLRRVGFAQSIIGNPPILLLDEPTDGLDPNQKEHMHTLIREMKKDKTILISTHLLEEVEELASRIILIDKGRIVANGTLKDILTQTKQKKLCDAFRSLTTKTAEEF
jgi:ABC-2 type transport system ATP-binding protein